MYGIPLDGNVRLRTNATLREYARLEYRNEDVYWVAAAVKAASAKPRPRRRLGIFGRTPRPAHRPVAHKGAPRLELQEASSPG